MDIKHSIPIEEVFSEIKECFKTLCIKCLAVRENDKWFNIMMTGFLSMKDEELLKNQIMKEYDQLEKLGVTKLEKLLITYDIHKATDFPKVIQDILSGSINLHGQVITLGEKVQGRIEKDSYLLSQEPYNFPKINFIARVDQRGIETHIPKIEEDLKTFGYTSIDELGLQWLMLPQLRVYTFSVTIDIPIYFIPLSLSLDGNTVKFDAISHRSLIPKLKLRLTLRRLFQRKEYVPIENYRLRFQTIPSSDDIVTVTITQPLKSALNHEDIIEVIVASKLGILCKKVGTVNNLLQKEIIIGDFPKLLTQFISLDELEALIKREKIVGGVVKRPELSFQRAIAWLLSILGFQVIELEGTRYKEMTDIDGTRRETDMLMFDPETKKMYVIDITLRVPKTDKIDDIDNLQLALQRNGIFVKPFIITADYAGETKKNIRGVKILDFEDLKNIINNIRLGNIKVAKMIITE